MGVPVYKRILDLFEAEGINTLFGIPDPNFVHMFTEAEARGWSVVAPHHELSAGFMAEAASRMTGKPGLCIGTLGPGMANIAGAIQCALVENSPVIFLGGQRARVTERRVRRGLGLVATIEQRLHFGADVLVMAQRLLPDEIRAADVLAGPHDGRRIRCAARGPGPGCHP